MGAFDIAPAGGIETATPPSNATSTWTGTEWSAPTITAVEVTKEQFKHTLKKLLRTGILLSVFVMQNQLISTSGKQTNV